MRGGLKKMEKQSEALLRSFINNVLHRNGSFAYIFT